MHNKSQWNYQSIIYTVYNYGTTFRSTTFRSSTTCTTKVKQQLYQLR